MGKLSDVIKHAGELSEETDDEDLWEDEEPESETAETEPENEQAEDGRRDPKAAGDVPEEDFSETDAGAADTRGWTDSAADEAGKTDFAAENMVVPTEEENEATAEENSEPAEDTEPECNEEGVPLKDILYAENLRSRGKSGKDQIIVQSVYDRKTIRDMLFRHAYLSTGGYCGLLISFCSIGAAIYTYGRIQVWISFVLLLAGCIFTVIEPFLLRDRAKQMTRQGGIYYMPILFVLTPYGIELTRNGNHASHDWGDITRVTTTKYAVVMYKGRHTALVLTKRGIGDQKDRLYAMIRQCARNAKYMKLK
ncbi:MAG: YcxB family protein [Lachnospiraceae bacterium]|nr:YcxB family protein [Lachnospiraceae bacterium]